MFKRPGVRFIAAEGVIVERVIFNSSSSVGFVARFDIRDVCVIFIVCLDASLVDSFSF